MKFSEYLFVVSSKAIAVGKVVATFRTDNNGNVFAVDLFFAITGIFHGTLCYQ
ncbi:hypothetical protein D3C80_783350 [compost metagenome]